MIKKYCQFCTLLLAVLYLQNCTTYQNIAYFKDVPDSTRVALKTALYTELKIQQGDVLNVTVMTMDPAANAIFSQQESSSISAKGATSPGASSSGAGGIGATSPSGYMVDKNGEIEMPLFGKFKAENLSTDSLRNVIQAKASEYYKAPAVIVKFANFKINVLGEVLKPGTYVLNSEKNTILDALAMAGDLTIFGKRENVLLIRDSAGITKMNRFSLSSKDLVKLDFYYLKQNDVIYVEPNKAKAAALDADKARNYTLAASILTVIIILASRL